MPSIPLYPPPQPSSNPMPSSTTTTNPLPSLLQTPSGLALLEIQGTIHSSGISLSSDTDSHNHNHDELNAPPSTADSATHQPKTREIGRLVFPDYDPTSTDDQKWMKKVYLYIGKHQRMGGEVRELRNAVAVVRRRQRAPLESESATNGGDDGEEAKEGDEDDELEIAEIIRYKVVFANRPEPVGAEEVVALT